MKIPMFQVDAFARTVFSGNPAAVCALESWIYDATLQRIAAENNVSATAFIVPHRGEYQIRWFTPLAEIPLCGHGTLAAGWVVLHLLQPRRDAVRFASTAGGELRVERDSSSSDGERLAMTLPRQDPKPLASPPPALAAALGAPPKEQLATDHKYLCVYDDAATVETLAPDFAALAQLDRSVCVTAPGGAFGCDFVSRVFAPRAGIPEDPVTGAAHCLLTPYWGARLERATLFAKQLSKRGGELWCQLGGREITLSGYVSPYLAGEIEV
jgi:PhzF family phenazine biosynthesis protein